jgi:hypothetical protein
MRCVTCLHAWQDFSNLRKPVFLLLLVRHGDLVRCLLSSSSWLFGKQAKKSHGSAPLAAVFRCVWIRYGGGARDARRDARHGRGEALKVTGLIEYDWIQFNTMGLDWILLSARIRYAQPNCCPGRELSVRES